ncbi:P-type conjugative transfer protein TrbJ [Sphingomonas sp. ABOLF]|uniref:P-type conjugative transfer protein TrbJ n=1 Tax=Sphingomonas sp. ABOLF TaxID=1985879 RepID=UPI0013DF80BF|nr:P-type conjugative transfer protein TrbJ [Sphingomonas sp. ABOLF]
MLRYSKIALAAAVALAPLTVGLSSSPASAQLAVIDVRAIAQMTQQVAQQARQLQQQIQQYQNMVVNTATLPAQQWGQTMQAINQVNSLLQQAQSLSYQSGNIEQQIRSRYQGYGTYSSNGMTSSDMAAKYRQWSDETNSSIGATMRALGLQNSQLADEEAVMRQLESMGNTAQGRMQAAQVGNQLAAQAVRQTQKLRQLQMMQMQMQANYYAQQQDLQAAQAAAGARAYGRSNYSTRGGKAF